MSSTQEIRHILVIEDQKSRRIVSLKESTYSIGRDPNSSIPLYDRQVSRHHATLLRVTDYQTNGYLYRIIDGNLQGKKSTNGVVVNGKYCLSQELKHGDVVWFSNKAKVSYYIIANAAELAALKSGLSGDGIDRVDPQLLEVSTSFPEEARNTKAGEQPSTDILQVESKPERNSDETLQFSSLAEFSPNPIIEIDFEGKIPYLNPAARIKFPDLQSAKLEHPLFQGLSLDSQSKDRTSFVRDIQVNEDIFEQHIHYSAEGKSIRSYIFEVTRYKKLENELKAERERYRLLREQTSESILLVDSSTKQILEANQAYSDLTGYTLDELLQLTLYDVVAIDCEIVDSDLQQVTPLTPYLIEESLYRHKDGSTIDVEVKVSLSSYEDKDIFSLVVRDISERKKSAEVLQYQAFHDPLTNLPNRTLFNKQLSIALANAERNQNLMAVMFLDIDSFQNINNTLGHSIGDEVLQSFGSRLTSCLRDGDTVARWGGDEFTLLLPHIKSTDDTIKLAQRIFEILKQPFDTEKQQLQLKTSIGIAIYPQDGADRETLLKNADAALCRTKEQGRNHYQFYNPTMTSEASLMLKLETLLHQALDRQQFSLYYQPQVEAKTGKITGMETLLRWQHPELGFVAPNKFIHLAEKTDLITHIGKWVLKTACEQNVAWQKAGLPLMPIAVNISARELQQPNLAETVARVLDATGLDPHWLELEITEVTLTQSLESARQTLRDLQQLGVRLSLDDFGTGNSSVGYLKQVAFHSLKIDGTFIRNLRGNEQERAIISAAIALGRGFNLRVIAEGVETQSQLELLQSLDCEEMQGYWFSRPLSTEDATQLLSKNATV